MAALAVCGGYQLFARYYRPAVGDDLPGLGIFDAWTEHPGEGVPRCIGNVVAEWQDGVIVGFENHGGRTYLGPNARPLARVRAGCGNNGVDKTEGAVYKNAHGTYLHGSLLPKNPRFADHLLRLALGRRHAGLDLPPLDDCAGGGGPRRCRPRRSRRAAPLTDPRDDGHLRRRDGQQTSLALGSGIVSDSRGHTESVMSMLRATLLALSFLGLGIVLTGCKGGDEPPAATAVATAGATESATDIRGVNALIAASPAIPRRSPHS